MNATTTKEIKFKAEKNLAPIPAGTECQIVFNNGNPVCHVHAPGREPVRIACESLPNYFANDFERPSMEQLGEWVNDGVCESLTGDTVEPDGWGPDGAPSWLLALRMI